MKKAEIYTEWILSHPITGPLREKLFDTLQVSKVEGYVGDDGWTTALLVEDVELNFEEERGGKYYYPRELFSIEELKKEGYKVEDLRPTSFRTSRPLQDAAHSITLRNEVQEHAYNAFKNGNSGHLILAPGKGKTVISLKICAEDGAPIIVFAHNGALLTQWIERVEEHLPGATVGGATGPFKKWEWRDKDVVVATFQSFFSQYGQKSRTEEFQEFLNYFKWVIFDESHHLKARTFSLASRSFPANRLALTATPLQNGFEKIAYAHIGPVRYQNDEHDLIPTVFTHQIKLEPSHPVHKVRGGATQHTMMMSALLGGGARTPISREYMEPIMALTKKKIEEGRKVLILSPRVLPGHYIESEFFPGMSVLSGEVPFEMRTELLWATNPVYVTAGIGEEGLDRPELDTLILLAPYAAGKLSVNKFSQVAGRILRQGEGKQDPEVHVFFPTGQVGRKYQAATIRASRTLGFKLSSEAQSLTTLDKYRRKAHKRARQEIKEAPSHKKVDLSAEEKLKRRMRRLIKEKG